MTVAYISSFNVIVVSCYATKTHLQKCCDPHPSDFIGQVKWAEDGGPIGKDKFKKHLGVRTRWWQLKHFWNFHPYLGKIPISTSLKPPTREFLRKG